MNRLNYDLICPLCHTYNGCKAHSDMPCWCNSIKIAQALLDLVPQEQKGKACICRSCVEAFQSDPKKFTEQISLTTLYPKK